MLDTLHTHTQTVTLPFEYKITQNEKRERVRWIKKNGSKSKRFLFFWYYITLHINFGSMHVSRDTNGWLQIIIWCILAKELLRKKEVFHIYQIKFKLIRSGQFG